MDLGDPIRELEITPTEDPVRRSREQQPDEQETPATPAEQPIPA